MIRFEGVKMESIIKRDDYPKILEMNIHSDFRFLWLKYIRSVNLNYHCAKGLNGRNDDRIKKYKTESVTSFSDIRLDQDEVDFYYICGVATPPNWSANFHCAFRYENGEIISVNENGIDINIQDAVRIPIEEVDRETCTNEHKDKKEYYTCRNWMFAHKWDEYIDKWGKKRKYI